MPQNIIDADNWTLTVEVAADGDAVNGASQVLVGQDLADRALYTRNRTLGPVGGSAEYHSPIANYGWMTNWQLFDDPTGLPPVTPHFAMQQTGTGGTADFFAAPIWTPFSGRIVAVSITLNGNGGGSVGHGSVPAVLPVLSVYRQDVLGVGGLRSLVGSVTDGSLTVPVYESWRKLIVSGLALDLNDTASHWIEVTGEGGAGAVASALLVTDLIISVEPAP